MASVGSVEFYKESLTNLLARTGGPYRVLKSPSDFFYVARQHFQQVLTIFDLANRHKVFQEVVIHTTFACLNETTYGYLDPSGDNTGDGNRQMPWSAYYSNWLFMHPFKLSLISASDVNIRNQYFADGCLYCMLAEHSRRFRSNFTSPFR